VEREREIRAIEAVLGGDPEPYAEIVNGYQRLVASVAWKMNVAPDTIEDVVSEVFLKAYRNLHRYDPSYAFSTWLYRLTTNHILDQIRRRKRRPETNLEALPEPADGGEGADTRLAVRERADLVRQAVSDLPDIYRQVMTLHHLESIPVAEVARILDVPEGTVKVRLMRGRDRLRKALEESAPEHFGGSA
jgi:RNA polymerase sigma-70 factor (ECF subfamily)